MRHKQLIVILAVAVIGMAVTVYSRGKGTHRFPKKQCSICHQDVDGDAANLKTISSDICTGCHKRDGTQSHPIDFFPTIPPPVDMPLVDGKLSCITCHFVHKTSVHNKKYSFALLRRPGRGRIFCGVCHEINEQGHIVFEGIHGGSYKVTNRNEKIDRSSLQCIECHDDYLNIPTKSLGSGSWLHRRNKFNHPVGISYVAVAARKPKEFVSPGSLRAEIRLFDGKIGCGSCHNVYSKESFMLVMSNRGSKLCLECHNL